MTEKEFNNVAAAGVITLVASFVVDTAHRIWSRRKTDKALRDSIAEQEKREQERHQRIIDQQNDLDRQLMDMERDREKAYEEVRKSNDKARAVFEHHLDDILRSIKDDKEEEDDEEDDGLE